VHEGVVRIRRKPHVVEQRRQPFRPRDDERFLEVQLGRIVFRVDDLRREEHPVISRDLETCTH
jgi:hypothetical protein